MSTVQRPTILRSLRSVFGQDFAGPVQILSRRLLVRDSDYAPLSVDEWDSVGPGQGRLAASGGFVDPHEPYGRCDDVTVLYSVRPTNVLIPLARAARAKASDQAGSAPPRPAAERW